jgi:two-component system, sensor histidine kinase PdtaS
MKLMDTAIPLGLIINELLTNSFKYAFNESNQNGYIHIAAQYKSKNDPVVNTVELIYKDSGTGFNPLLFENTNTLGLKLIKLLSHQIGASVQYQNNKESIFTFTWQSNI